MMNILKYEKDEKREDNIIKDIKNLFRLRKEIDNSGTKNIRNLFILKMKTKKSKTK